MALLFPTPFNLQLLPRGDRGAFSLLTFSGGSNSPVILVWPSPQDDSAFP